MPGASRRHFLHSDRLQALQEPQGDVAVDIGRVVNRDITLQQIEGGLLYGVGLALGSASLWIRSTRISDMSSNSHVILAALLMACPHAIAVFYGGIERHSRCD